MSNNDIRDEQAHPESKGCIRFEVVETPEFDSRGNRIYARVWRDR